jgi:hypothetical protein
LLCVCDPITVPVTETMEYILNRALPDTIVSISHSSGGGRCDGPLHPKIGPAIDAI